MRIGIIGVCNITLEIAHRAAQSGHEVLISHTRCNESLRPVIQKMGSKVKLVTKDKAVTPRIIILFIPREDLKAFLDNLPDMTEKILLHTNNPFFNVDSLQCDDEKKSSSEIITSLLPAAHVVKIFNVIHPEMILPKYENQNGNEIFYTGTNRQAKSKVKSFLKTLNYSGCDLEELYQIGKC
jgi:predicted dinucleotide-binding enzyme